ncbi:MAG TPA: imidazole glycerol phosphate synthase subunit HisH [Puia sp.]|nr:imidazole glycerol phosphate synthase subunit HisH [Puia sp.]
MEQEKKVVIIDYQLGNLFSVRQACNFIGYNAVITTDKKELLKADYAILPGVGAFADAMKNLAQSDLVSPIKDFIASGRPFMGVCLGLQLLFTESEEFGMSKGLNIIEGTVKHFPGRNAANEISKVPQIGWNKIFETKNQPWKNTPLRDCRSGDYMYFVHSFYVKPQSEKPVLSETTYGDLTYCSSIYQDNVFACQFHPEKSGMYGVEIYRKWFVDGLQQKIVSAGQAGDIARD